MTARTFTRDEAIVEGMLLAWWAATQPSVRAVVSPSGERTFAQLNANANRVTRALRARGLQPGDAVALMCGNRPEFVEVVHACQRGGYRLTPINWHLTGHEAGYILNDCEAVALVASEDLAPAALAALDLAPACSVRLAVGGPIAGFSPYDDVIAEHSDEDIDDPTPGGTMLYTSGTTGKPKGVHRPPGTVAARAINLFGYAEGASDVHLCTGPLYHAAPLAFSMASPLSYGVGIVLMETWDAEETLRLVDLHRITHTHMVPTMFHRLLSLPAEVRAKYNTSSLRSVIHGAAPCPVAIKSQLIEWLGPVVWEYYAATEGAGTFVDSATWLSRPGTVGKPAIDGYVIVGDESAQALPAGEIGLVYIKAPPTGRFDYFKDEAKTSGTYRGDYFTLGDVGYMDADGYLFLTDRSADLIISGGVNIYPAEVDAVLIQHPAVGDVATIGLPDQEWGERVASIVELQPGVAADSDLASELIEFCRNRLAHYKCPRTVEFVDQLPRQDNGKIYKRLLRKERSAG